MARLKSKICPGCNTVFKTKNAATCSTRCRMRLHRAGRSVGAGSEALHKTKQTLTRDVVALKESAEHILKSTEEAFKQLGAELTPFATEEGFVGESTASATATAPTSVAFTPIPTTPPVTPPVTPPTPTFVANPAPTPIPTPTPPATPVAPTPTPPASVQTPTPISQPVIPTPPPVTPTSFPITPITTPQTATVTTSATPTPVASTPPPVTPTPQTSISPTPITVATPPKPALQAEPLETPSPRVIPSSLEASVQDSSKRLPPSIASQITPVSNPTVPVTASPIPQAQPRAEESLEFTPSSAIPVSSPTTPSQTIFGNSYTPKYSLDQSPVTGSSLDQPTSTPQPSQFSPSSILPPQTTNPPVASKLPKPRIPKLNFPSWARMAIASTMVISIVAIGTYLLGNQNAQTKISSQTTTTTTTSQDSLPSGSDVTSLHFNKAVTIDQGASFTATGTASFKNLANSADAFNIQNAAGDSLVHVNTVTGLVTINGLQGSGALLTNVNASNINTGTVADARLSDRVTLLGNNFNSAGQLIQLNNSGAIPTLDGSNLINVNALSLQGNNAAYFTNASNTIAGTLSDARLSTNVTLSGNTFNGADQLVQLNNSGALPTLNGANITNVDALTLQGNSASYFTNATNITSGSLSDARLSANVALLNGTGPQTFTGSNKFTGPTVFQTLTNSTNGFQLQNQAGNNNLIIGDTVNTRIGIGVAIPNFTLDVNGDANIANGQAYRINGVAVCTNVGCNPSGGSNSYVQVQASTPGTAQTGNLNITGTAIAGTFSGSGLGLTNLDASQIAAGTLNDLRLSANVTLQGNNFNGASQLVKTTALSYLPALNGSLLTNLNASSITTGTIGDGRLSANVALLNGTGPQTFSGNNAFSNVIVAPGIQTTNTGHIINVAFSGIATGAVTYNFDVAATPGTYTICTSIGNCSGGAGTVTTVGGTLNKVAKFSGSQAIVDSIITDNGTTVSVAGTLNATAITQNSNTVCDVSGNCAGVGGQVGTFGTPTAGTIALFHGSATIENSILTQAAGTVSAGGNLNVTGNYQVGGVQITSAALSNDSNLAKLSANQTFTGNQTYTGTVLIQPAVDATSISVIQNHLGTSNLFIADTSNTRIGIGKLPAYTLDVNGDINVSTGGSYRINGTAICGPSTTCAPSSGSTSYIQNGVAQQTSANFNIQSTATGSVVGVLQGKTGQTADLLQIKDGSANTVLSVGNQGQTIFKDSSAGSATFFQIQNSSSVSLLTANTTTGQILLPNANLASTALLIGGDANLYRSAASTLKTDGNAVIAGTATVSGTTTLNGTVLAKNTTDSTTAFQIQNSNSTAILAADTTNQNITVTNLQATGSISLQNSQGASIQLRTVSSSSTGLTVSGNEITDKTRSTGTQGDGRQTPDSSTGIWEATTNLVPLGGAESAIAQYYLNNQSMTISRTSEVAKFGTYSFKAVGSGTGTQSVEWRSDSVGTRTPVTAGQTYTMSLWEKSLAGYAKTPILNVVYYDVGGSIIQNTNTSVAVPSPSSWTRVSYTSTAPALAVSVRLIWTVQTVGAVGETYYFDGVQFENKAYATPYVETNLATASRSAASITGPSATLGSQGWLAFRIRAGIVNTSANNATLFKLTDSNGYTLNVHYTASGVNVWAISLVDNNGTSATNQASTFNPGDYVTIIATWKSNQLGISVNGANFSTVTVSPATTFGGTMSTFNIGTDGTNPIDSDILWSTSGSGTLSNSDAITLNAYGNSDPTISGLSSLNSGAAIPTFAWDGVDTKYSGTNASYVSQSGITLDDTTLYRAAAAVLRTDGALQAAGGLSTMDANGDITARSTSSAKVFLGNIGSGVAGIQLGNASAANLYQSAASALKTDSSLQVVGALSTTSSISFTNTGNANQGISLKMVVTSAVNANDVVIIDTANAGQVTTVGASASNKVFGVATTTNTAGIAQGIVTSGVYQVTADTNAVSIGDLLVTSATTGQVASSTSPATGTVIGHALSAKAAGSSGLVWVYLTPGAGGSGSSGSSSYGMMESDWVNTGATLPTTLAVSKTVTIGNTIYLFGGQTPAGTTVKTIFSAPVSNPTSWTNTGATLPGNLDYTSIAVVGSNIYSFGGDNGVTAINSIYSAPVSSPTTWTNTGATIPGNLSGSSLAIINGYIYLFGGYNGSGRTNVIYSAPVSNPTSWTSTGATLPGNLDESHVAVIGNYVYLFGGYNGSAYTNVIYRAPISSPTTWSNTGSTLPAILGNGQLTVIGNYVYILGGFSAGYVSAIYRAPINNPVSGWTTLSATLPGALGFSSVSIVGNAVYLFGGNNSSAVNTIYSAPIFNGSPDISSNPSWITATNVASGGGVSTGNAGTSTELAYAELTSTAGGLNQTVEASATTILSAPSITTDGNTSIFVDFWAPYVDAPPVANANIKLILFDGSTPIGTEFHQRDENTTSNSADTPMNLERRLTPSAGSHTYSIRAIVSSGTGSVGAGPGGTGNYMPAYIRVTLANPLQGGNNGGIQNGTTTQAANFNIQSNSASSPTGILKGASSQSADIFDVQNSSGTNLLRVDPSGNVSVAGLIGFTNSGNANQAMSVNMPVTVAITANQLVVIDTNNAGQVTTTTTQGSTKVFGITTATGLAGASQAIVTSGVYQVTADTNAVSVGDFLIASSTAGQAVSSSSPSAGAVIGRALSAKAGGSSGLVWIQVTPGLGGGGGSSGGLTQYGLMESDFTTSGSTLPAPLGSSQSAVIGNYIYLFGGSSSNVIYRAPTSSPTTWTSVGTLPTNLSDSALAIIGGNIYLFGGYNAGYTNVIYSAPVANPTSWSNTGSTLPGNLGNSSLAVIGNTIYLFGGNSGSATNVIYSAPVANPTSWSNTGSTLPGNLSASSLAVVGNYVYLFGGYNAAGVSQQVIYRASISSPTTWANTTGTIPGIAHGSSLAVIGNYIYLMGGYNTGTASILNVIYRAPINNPVNGWTNTGSVLPANTYYSSVAIVGSAIYLLGGASSSAIYTAPVFTNSPDTTSNPSWKVAANTSSGGGSSTAGQLAYNEFTGNVSVTHTTEATADTVVTASATNFDGSTPVTITFFTPFTSTPSANSQINIYLYDGSTSLGYLGASVSGGGSVQEPVTTSRQLTPSAGSHTYSVRVSINSGTGTIGGGIGGTGAILPGYIRITTANGTGGSAGSVANGTALQTGNFNIQSAGAAYVAASIQGAVGQSADLLDIKNGAGTIVFNLDSAGNVTVAGNLTLSAGKLITSSTSIYVTSLPVSPVDGQEVYYKADATNGVIWHLRYNAGSASTYKWEYLGGADMISVITTEQSPGSTSAWVNLTTNGPSVTVPASGEYEVTFSVDFRAATSSRMTVGVAVGDTTPPLPWADTNNQLAAGYAVHRYALGPYRATFSAGDVVKLRYDSSDSTNTFYGNRQLSLRPIRVTQ